MADELTSHYPGSKATASEVIALADEYRLAALTLFQSGRSGEPLSRAPARLCSIQSIELYLNAYMLHEGDPPEKIRGYLHNLSDRIKPEIKEALRLRKRTADHLIKMMEKREYLIARYGPELVFSLSEVNRMQATLEEVANKVKLHTAKT